MTEVALPSDTIVRRICISIAVLSFIVNTITLILIVKLRKIYTNNIYFVLVSLQTIYLIQNFHFCILFIPFVFSTLGGGYCIGVICEPHYTSFQFNFVVWIFLTVLLCGFFIILLFYRHQNLLSESSELKLGSRTGKLFSMLLIMYISIPAFRYTLVTVHQSEQENEQLLGKLFPEGGWIAERRNFGVISRGDSVINGILIGIITCSCVIFVFGCGGHIMYLAERFLVRSNVMCRINLRQTMISIIQIKIFGAFLAVPIGLTVSMLWIGHHTNCFTVLSIISLFLSNIHQYSASSFAQFTGSFTDDPTGNSAHHSINQPAVDD